VDDRRAADIQGDRAATEHKLQFFTNGATPNMVVKGITAATKEQFAEIVDMMERSTPASPTPTRPCT
jgi:hypothetical protein